MNRSSSTTISAELGLRLVVPQQTIVPLVASMFYSGSDPYAVRMAFPVGTDEPVEWIFARDLLAAGIESRQGDGDVHGRRRFTRTALFVANDDNVRGRGLSRARLDQHNAYLTMPPFLSA